MVFVIGEGGRQGSCLSSSSEASDVYESQVVLCLCCVVCCVVCVFVSVYVCVSVSVCVS